MSDEAAVFEGWAVVELMGHRRLAGYVTETTVAGAGFLRLDVPAAQPFGIDGAPASPVATQFYSPSSVYCLTPTTEDVARKVAGLSSPQPATRWELSRGDDPEEPF